ncbi:hypothetical protein D3C84_1031590 [compost metagenome]
MEYRCGTNRIEIAQKAGIEISHAMQALFLAYQPDPAVGEANSGIAFKEQEALLQIGWCHVIIRIQTADIATARLLNARISR